MPRAASKISPRAANVTYKKENKLLTGKFRCKLLVFRITKACKYEIQRTTGNYISTQVLYYSASSCGDGFHSGSYHHSHDGVEQSKMGSEIA